MPLPHPPASPPSFPVADIRPLVGIIEASGLDTGRILRRAQLPEDKFAHDGLIALADYFRICEQVALESEDESCHVSLRPLMVGTSAFVQARLAECRTLGQVMEVVASSYNVIHGKRYNLVRRRGEAVSYVIDDTDFPYSLGQDDAFIILSIESLLVCVHGVMLALGATPTLPLRRIRTRAAEPEPGATHLSFWRVPIRYRSPAYALDYDQAVEAIPVDPARGRALAARTIYGSVASIIDRLPAAHPSAVDDISDRVAQEIRTGRHDQPEIATRLGLSVASLRRRLADSGVRFRDLRAQVLRDEAERRLDAGMSIADVADQLGFADGRSFARAFREWTGRSPAEHRRSSQG